MESISKLFKFSFLNSKKRKHIEEYFNEHIFHNEDFSSIPNLDVMCKQIEKYQKAFGDYVLSYEGDDKYTEYTNRNNLISAVIKIYNDRLVEKLGFGPSWLHPVFNRFSEENYITFHHSSSADIMVLFVRLWMKENEQKIEGKYMLLLTYNLTMENKFCSTIDLSNYIPELYQKYKKYIEFFRNNHVMFRQRRLMTSTDHQADDRDFSEYVTNWAKENTEDPMNDLPNIVRYEFGDQWISKIETLAPNVYKKFKKTIIGSSSQESLNSKEKFVYKNDEEDDDKWTKREIQLVKTFFRIKISENKQDTHDIIKDAISEFGKNSINMYLDSLKSKTQKH